MQRPFLLSTPIFCLTALLCHSPDALAAPASGTNDKPAAAASATASNPVNTTTSAPANTSAALSTEQQALHVLNRLAYGPKPGDVQYVQKIGVAAYIAQQLQPETIPLPASLQQRLARLETEQAGSGQMLTAFREARQAARSDNASDKQQAKEEAMHVAEQRAEGRLLRAIDSPRQLEEVMVDFWYNHFNVYAGKGLDRALITSYERDAIRPYVLGNLRQLLGATAKHPAMLFYLDNWLSTKAGYTAQRALRFGLSPQKVKASGLNENYARELMELHTLGVDGGYTQNDVTELARMFTGWTFAARGGIDSNELFRFDPLRHDNGSKIWLGKTVTANGQAEGEFALDVLAQHPATAKFISFKLAQYFVQDQPDAKLVQNLAQVFLQNKGEIRPVLKALFASPGFLNASGSKFKTPYQFVVSATRASAIPVENIRPLLGTLQQLGMPLYGSPTPDGYKNTEAAWLNPDALTRRIQFATALATGRLPLGQAPKNPTMSKKQLERQATPGEQALAQNSSADTAKLLATLGSSISPATREIIQQQPATLRAAMVLGSPDFMRH
ncbi:MAG: hypothetical protein RL748_1216 [Pseudomonadota bacterium]